MPHKHKQLVSVYGYLQVGEVGKGEIKINIASWRWIQLEFVVGEFGCISSRAVHLSINKQQLKPDAGYARDT
jgi:hypothetical protein